jgi:hypothetical protein
MFSAWVLSPDGYTILPMRLPTTISEIIVFMGRSVNGKYMPRQPSKFDQNQNELAQDLPAPLQCE